MQKKCDTNKRAQRWTFVYWSWKQEVRPGIHGRFAHTRHNDNASETTRLYEVISM